MTKIVLKQLKKKHPDLRSGPGRGAVGKVSGGVGIGCNVLLFAVKLAVGIFSGSVSVMADVPMTMHSADRSRS